MSEITKTIMNEYRKFKLGNSVFKNEYQISKIEFKHSKLTNEDIEKLAKRKSVEALSDYILSNLQSTTNRTETDESIRIKTEIMAFNFNDFKILVETAIQLIPQSEIDRIKSGENILK